MEDLCNLGFDKDILQEARKKMQNISRAEKEKLRKVATGDHAEKSIRIHLIDLQRDIIVNLFKTKKINEIVFIELESEIDMMLDSLEYPQIYTSPVLQEGKFTTSYSLRKKILSLRTKISFIPFLGKFFDITQQKLVHERATLYWARSIYCVKSLQFLDNIEQYFEHDIIENIEREIYFQLEENQKSFQLLKKKYPKIIKRFQQRKVKRIFNE